MAEERVCEKHGIYQAEVIDFTNFGDFKLYSSCPLCLKDYEQEEEKLSMEKKNKDIGTIGVPEK